MKKEKIQTQAVLTLLLSVVYTHLYINGYYINLYVNLQN